MLFLPDIRTILLLSMLVNVVLAIAMLIYWRTQKTYSGFGYMVIANGLFALTFLFFAFRGFIPPAVSIVGANFLTILSASYRLEGIRHFLGAKAVIKHNFAFSIVFGIVMALLSGYLVDIRDGLYIRTLLISGCILVFCAWIAWEAFKADAEHERLLLWIIGFVHVGYCLLLLLRSSVWIVSPAERNLFSPSLVNSAFFIYDLLNHIGLSIVYIMLNSRRLAKNLTAVQQELEILATKDSLTELYNNRTFCERGQSELLRTRRFDHPLSILMMDVDHFKIVNDTYGHAAGDKVLKAVGTKIAQVARQSDVLGRMGGDEFVMLLPETSGEQAKAVAERLLQGMAESSCDWETARIKVTLSIGLVELVAEDRDFESLLRRADEALYEAKRCGRNQIVAWFGNHAR